MVLDSIVCEGGNYRIYVNLCIGAGVTGMAQGAGGSTREFAFGLYSASSSMSVLNFTPATVSGDSTGSTYTGANMGPIATIGTQATVAYLSYQTTTPFTCVSTNNQCGMKHTQCDQYSFLVSEIPDSIRVFGIEGDGNIMQGCLDTDMVLQGLQKPDVGPDTLICRGDTINLGLQAAQSGMNYLWSPPNFLNDPTLAQPQAWPQNTTRYALTVTAQGACVLAGSDSVTITVDTACVWPGDCNYDLIANYLDIFQIGIAYNFSGPVRPTMGLQWMGHPAYDWSNSFVNGPNYKHADSNGDGVVNMADVMGILTNYGRTHTANRLNASSGGALHFIPLPDSATTGDTLWVVAQLGTAAQPADSVYGVGFQFIYPKDIIDSSSVVVIYDSSWLGTDSVDMATLDYRIAQDGVLEVGMTRIDHINRTGYGEICRIGIAIQDDISGKIETFISKIAEFRLEGAVMISADEQQRLLNVVTDSVVIWQSSLPVTWTGFQGSALPTGIQLSWATLQEINANHFNIERAAPGGSFASIGTVTATGNSNSRASYDFLDKAPLIGENLYRLKEVDLDGSETESTTISVFYHEGNEIGLVSPPFFRDDALLFTLSSAEAQTVQLQIYDLRGQQLVDAALYLQAGSQSFTHLVQGLSAGAYLFQLKTSSQRITHKVIR